MMQNALTMLDVLLAALPPLLVLVLMVGFRWGGSKAGPAGWFAALIIAVLRFGAGLEVIGYAHVRTLILTLDVAWIIWNALLLYQVVREAGALEVIAAWFIRLTGDPLLRVLLLGWVFTSFLQGVGGFGVPVAIVAPLLVGLGLPPLAAVVIPSIGHAWAVTFGSLASSFIVLVSTTGLPADLLAPPAAFLLGLAAFGCGALAAHAYAGWRGAWHGLPAVAAIGLAMALGQYLLATNGFWNIGAAGGGLAGLAVGLWVTRWPTYRAAAQAQTTPTPVVESPELSKRAMPSGVAFAGYVVLVVLAFVIKGVEPVNDLLGQVRFALAVPEVSTSPGWITPATPDLGLPVLSHTGTVLLYSALAAYLLYRWRGYYKPGAGQTIIAAAAKGGIGPALGILSMVGMATIMSNAGMTRALAEWLASAVPPDLYAFVAALIGAIGAFMTGSNTNSNAVFAGLQMDTAALLGLSVATVLAIQTASAGVVSLLAPAKIIVGASTVGLGGEEGVVLRKLLLYGGALMLLIMVAGLVLLRMGV